MLFHLSISAHDPRNVAQVIAELWRGHAHPFPPVAQGSWIALAGDDRGTAVEVYPIGTVLRETEGDADASGRASDESGFTATHAALATPLSQDEVMAIAAREGWPAKYRKRGGAFGVIELWIEGRQMMELLTQEMQAEYLAAMTGGGHPAQAAAPPA
ncbi:hypothetical protein L288_02080 [Sphingobium quisquiliarum P25]|uniref:Uncharacterized protein n=1 Tax=Sphingobium quisquiliarum P25 TaxID=1329909 RepID=T0HBQ9_9SPHN|nr:hypothetical protein [Sphingobium quisquiliarum]EQB13766.1 hypothetical protein L288_02080 [Sphingobium quisquiliarum P25]